MRISYFVKFLVVFVFCLNLVYSVNVEIKVNESSNVVKLLTGQYSLSATGEISIYNPSLVSRVYDFYIPMSFDALIGINLIGVDNSSSRFKYEYGKIKGFIIEPNETIRVGYKIFGLLNYNIYDNIGAGNSSSVFSYYADDFELTSKLIVNLDKPQREGFVYNLNGSLNSSPSPTFNTTRVISAGIQNPTDFDYFIKVIKLYRTKTADPFFSDGDLIDKQFNISVPSFARKLINFRDLYSNDFSVYWISTSVIIDYVLGEVVDKSYSVQFQPASSSSGGGGGGGASLGGGGGGYFADEEGGIVNSILLKKSVDKTLIKKGDEFKVSLQIVNINDFKLFNLTLYDSIPKNYVIKDVSAGVKIVDKSKLIFKIDEVGDYETFVVEYTLVNEEDLNGITFLKPAELVYENVSIYSDGVLLINGILPDKKVFVQKEIDYVDDEFAKVTIKVKNLGSVQLYDLIITDDIDDNVIIKSISQVFQERGIWKIRELKPGEEWEVSYLIERNGKLDTLPNVFGVDKTDTYGTLISSEEIVTVFREEPKTVEKVGMILAVGLLVFYLLF